MSKGGTPKIGEGIGWAYLRKGAKEIDAAINTGRVQIIQEPGDFWNPPHARINHETGWGRTAEDKAPDPTAPDVSRTDLYGKEQEPEMDK